MKPRALRLDRNLSRESTTTIGCIGLVISVHVDEDMIHRMSLQTKSLAMIPIRIAAVCTRFASSAEGIRVSLQTLPRGQRWLALACVTLLQACSSFSGLMGELQPPGAADRNIFALREHQTDAPIIDPEPPVGQAIDRLWREGKPTGKTANLARQPLQIALSTPRSEDGYSTLLFVERPSVFNHAAVLIEEPDGIFAYEANSRAVPFALGIELIGQIKRLPLDSWLETTAFVAIYELPEGVDGKKVADYVRRQYANRTPYDRDFDDTTEDALYCSEFVARALQAGGAPLPPLASWSQHPSIAVVRQALRMTSRGVYFPEHLVTGSRLRSVISTRASLEEAALERAAVLELLWRFRFARRVGELMNIVGLPHRPGLALSSGPRAFLEAARNLARTLPPSLPAGPSTLIPPEYTLAVKTLANRFFVDLPSQPNIAAADNR